MGVDDGGTSTDCRKRVASGRDHCRTGYTATINFKIGFNGRFAEGARSVVANNSVDENKPVCGGLSFPSTIVDAPGCVNKSGR